MESRNHHKDPELEASYTCFQNLRRLAGPLIAFDCVIRVIAALRLASATSESSSESGFRDLAGEEASEGDDLCDEFGSFTGEGVRAFGDEAAAGRAGTPNESSSSSVSSPTAAACADVLCLENG